MDRRDDTTSRPVDSRIALYRALRVLALVVILGGAIKYGCVDTYPIATTQMRPALRAGDRVVVLKGAYRGPLRLVLDPRRGRPVIFDHPLVEGAAGCLRIVGTPGDTIAVSDGMLHIDGTPRLGPSSTAADCPRLPPHYSPRDWMAPFRLPHKGDTYHLDTLSHRDLLFVLSMMRQERPHRELHLRPSLRVDDTTANHYIMSDFALYKGRFDSIPDSLGASWFFWDRLEEYLEAREGAGKVTLSLDVVENDTAVTQYRVGKRHYFMLADQWCSGLDSRYFGPLCESAMRGRVACVLWSIGDTASTRPGFRVDRLFRFVK
jgi:signal peptidase I